MSTFEKRGKNTTLDSCGNVRNNTGKKKKEGRKNIY